jgi:hypothetical protein
VENVYDDDCFKEAGLSHQFPMFSTSIDNQLASKAKDSLEDRKKKGSGGFNKKKRSQATCAGAFQGNFMLVAGFSILLFFFTIFIESWNIRGLNDLVKHSAFCYLIQKHSVALFGLVKTHVRDVNKDSVSTLLFRSGLTCLILINLTVVVFEHVGILMC